MSPLRWAVSGRKPTYQPKVALQIDGVSPLRWAVSGRSPSSRPKVASTCNLSYFPYHTLILPYCPRTLKDGGSSTRMPPLHFCSPPLHLPYTSVSLPYTFRKPPLHFCKPPLDFCIPPLHYFLAIKKQRNRGYID